MWEGRKRLRLLILLYHAGILAKSGRRSVWYCVPIKRRLSAVPEIDACPRGAIIFPVES
jgi:hypothetical protein